MISQGQCTVFKLNLLKGLETFVPGAQILINDIPTPVVYKIALYTASANLNNSTLTYTPDNEVSGVGYTAGGAVLTPIAPLSDSSNNVAYLSFENVTWTGSSFTARGALIYNSTTNAAVAVLDFGSDKSSANFTITFPVDAPTSAVLRLQ